MRGSKASSLLSAWTGVWKPPPSAPLVPASRLHFRVQAGLQQSGQGPRSGRPISSITESHITQSDSDVDYSLFDKPTKQVAKSNTTADASLAHYRKPTIGEIITPILLARDGPEGSQHVHRQDGALLPTPEAEIKAFGEMQKMLDIGEKKRVAKSNGLFEAAALVAFQNRGSKAALAWLDLCPSYASVLRGGPAETHILSLLEAVRRNTPYDPAGARAIFEKLVNVKGWHGSRATHQALDKIIKALFFRSNARNGVEVLCSTVVQHTESSRYHLRNRRIFSTRCYNFAINALVWTQHYDRALTMIRASRCQEGFWHPPLSVFTYRMFVQNVVDRPGGLEAIEEAQDHLKTIADATRSSRKAATGHSASEWNHNSVRRMISKASLLVKTHRLRADADQPWRARRGPQWDRTPRPVTDLPQLPERDMVAEARRALLEEAGANEPENRRDFLLRLVEYQSWITKRASGRTEQPVDPELQAALQQRHVFEGMWELAYFWLLCKNAQFEQALRHYFVTFESADWLPESVFMHALWQTHPVAQTGRISPYGKPEIISIINQCVVGAICQASFVEGPGHRAEVVRKRIPQLELCYETLLETWNLAHSQYSSLAIQKEVSSLNAIAFIPWLRTFSIHYHELDYLEASEVPSCEDIASLVSKLDIFNDLDSDTVPSTMSASAYRVLKVLLDMQNLAIRDIERVYSTVMFTLATDVHSCWPLLEHMAGRSGLIPEDSRLAQMPTNMQPYQKILEGLYAVRGGIGGPRSALPYAKEVKGWLFARMTEAASYSESTSSAERGFAGFHAQDVDDTLDQVLKMWDKLAMDVEEEQMREAERWGKTYHADGHDEFEQRDG